MPDGRKPQRPLRAWDGRKWARLRHATKVLALDLCLDKPFVYFDLMRDLRFTTEEAVDIKRGRLSGELEP